MNGSNTTLSFVFIIIKCIQYMVGPFGRIKSQKKTEIIFYNKISPTFVRLISYQEKEGGCYEGYTGK